MPLQINERRSNEGNQGQQPAPQVHPIEHVAQVEDVKNPPVILVNRNQDADVVVRALYSKQKCCTTTPKIDAARDAGA